MKKIYIIGTGVGLQDMTVRALKIVHAAQVLVGGRRLLDMFPESKAEKIEIRRNIEGLVDKIKKKHTSKKIVVLASGDPNFFGIAAAFYHAFPKKQIEIIPNITAFQVAFARIKEPWDDVSLISVHGRPLKNLDRIASACGTSVVYCDGVNTPAAVARYLIARAPFLQNEKAWIFEDIGGNAEKITSGKLSSFTGIKTSSLALMVIKNTCSRPVLPFGIPDNALSHQDGMITKRDIRLMTLARLKLSQAKVLWDIGAGSGSVAIEAANLYPALEVYAIEKHKKRYEMLIANVEKNKLISIHPVLGEAPLALRNLPDPDSIFLGGSGGKLVAIMSVIKRRLAKNGILVVNCVTIQSLHTVIMAFKQWGWRYEAVTAQHAYLRSGAQPEIFKPEHQIFIVHACRR